jgi:hypothetical protein
MIFTEAAVKAFTATGAVLNTRDSLVAESGPFLADTNQPGDSA